MTQLNWQQQPIKLVRSNKRKTIGLYVKERHIEVRAPHHVAINELTDFIHSKQQWLTKVLAEQEQQLTERPDFSVRRHIPFMDKQLEVELVHGNKLGWRDLDDRLILYVKNEEKDHIHHLLADFYLTKAKYVLHNKTHDLVSTLNWQHKLTDIRFRRTKSKWGHCTATGRIQYNWLILMAPESVIDYLIAHEVSHLKHLNHSDQFWQQVQAIHPSYKRDRQWLTANGHTLAL